MRQLPPFAALGHPRACVDRSEAQRDSLRKCETRAAISRTGATREWLRLTTGGCWWT